MPLQQLSFFVWLGIAILIGLVFLYVAIHSRRGGGPNPATVNRFRLLLLGVLGVSAVIFLAITLPQTPYPTEAQQPEKVVFVVGKQFNFAISEQPVPDEATYEEVTSFGSPVEVPLGKLAEFRVTSLDVNHGFALYDPDNTLIGQVQAMPGYMNRLRYRFTKPGNYQVLCLEYCGHGHHRMQGSFVVK